VNSIELERLHTCGVYPQREVAIVRGQGAHIWDEEGREYIDCVSGFGVANIGHCNPAVVSAVQHQVGRLITCPLIFYNDQRARLLERLTAVAPPGLDRAFLCNSGTESVEAALKFAKLATGRPKIIAARNGFHGRTMGALSATWEPKYRKYFEPLVPNFCHVPYNDLAAMRGIVDENTAAVILEVVQGEGGVNPGRPEYLRGVQALCADKGALFILDEVQTGFGRTGRLFACQHHDLRPDILCLAKGIAGGIPMGATLIGERVGELPTGAHGTTFGGNPLACAASLAAIEYIIDQDLPGEAARKGIWTLERLRAIDARVIREVRGLGLMIGVDLRVRPGRYLKALMAEGVMALPAGSTVLRLLPPLDISDNDLAFVCDQVEKVLVA